MKEIYKHILLICLIFIGFTMFIAITGEVSGGMITRILVKVCLAVGIGVDIAIGKILYDHDMLPNMEDE